MQISTKSLNRCHENVQERVMILEEAINGGSCVSNYCVGTGDLCAGNVMFSIWQEQVSR
jgi:hypothetical protein